MGAGSVPNKTLFVFTVSRLFPTTVMTRHTPWFASTRASYRGVLADNGTLLESNHRAAWNGVTAADSMPVACVALSAASTATLSCEA